MRTLISRAAVVAAAAVVLLGPSVGTASAAGAEAGTRTTAGARAVSGGTWGMAEEVPGTAALNTGGNAGVLSVSCPSAGNCSAGGNYNAAGQVFVVSEVHGAWGKAEEIPGTAALNAGGQAQVSSVSCASAGNCSAVGNYVDGSGQWQVFVVSQVHGAWGKAEEIPGTAALNVGGQAQVSSVSCASAGNCTAVGNYMQVTRHDQFHTQAFVVSEVNGSWGQAREVPGTAALNTGGYATVGSVSCAAAGNCTAGGLYIDRPGNQQAFVVSEVDGSWGQAREVPGIASLNRTGSAQVNSVSCASAGNCTAGGLYNDSSDRGQAFVVTQTHGIWGQAREVPGTGALNAGGSAGVNGAAIDSVSCASAGNCSAGGNYVDRSGHDQVFVATQTHGTWDKAEEIPGTAALNTRGGGAIASVSCASAGNCSTGGNYKDSSGHFEVFVASQVRGTWGKAEEVPGSAALNRGGFAEMASVSCAPAGTCSAGGFYTPSPNHLQAFVVSKT
jgi:hypothetical protein